MPPEVRGIVNTPTKPWPARLLVGVIAMSGATSQAATIGAPAFVTTSTARDRVDEAIAASEQGRHEEALSLIDEEIATRPTDARLHLRRSGILEAAIESGEATGGGPRDWQGIADGLDLAADAAERYLELAPAQAGNRDEVVARAATLRRRAVHARAKAEEVAAELVPLPGKPTVAEATDGGDQGHARHSNARRRALGGSLVGLGLGAAATGVGLLATSLRLNFPTGCSDDDPTTACQNVHVREDRARIGVGTAAGVASALLLGVGAGILARTPSGDELHTSPRRVVVSRATGATLIVGGLGVMGAAAAVGVKASQSYQAASATDEAQMRDALSSGKLVLALSVVGLAAIGTGVGLVAVPRAKASRAAISATPLVGQRFVGWSISGTLPW